MSYVCSAEGDFVRSAVVVVLYELESAPQSDNGTVAHEQNAARSCKMAAVVIAY